VDARHALLEGLIDYAGLFPPAALDLPTALRQFDGHQREPDAWMLGRFVLPAARLGEIEPWLDGPWLAERPLVLSLLADPGDLVAAAAFVAARPAVRIGALELKAPTAEQEPWFADLTAALAAAELVDREVYVELPAGSDAAVLDGLAARQADPPAARLGAKLRCGGVTADLVPGPERVAAVLAGARDRGVPLKFTAGLHHPVRGMDTTEGVPMHGFLNVYGAGLLARASDLDAAALLPVVTETDARAFRLDADGFAWRDRAVPAARVAEARARDLASYGSCSFDEPVTDLRSLAILT
jgi:hypothetical protein